MTNENDTVTLSRLELEPQFLNTRHNEIDEMTPPPPPSNSNGSSSRPAAGRKKWGSGGSDILLTSARRRRGNHGASVSSELNSFAPRGVDAVRGDTGGGGGGGDRSGSASSDGGDDNDLGWSVANDNPFESIGRALDRRERAAKQAEAEEADDRCARRRHDGAAEEEMIAQRAQAEDRSRGGLPKTTAFVPPRDGKSSACGDAAASIRRAGRPITGETSGFGFDNFGCARLANDGGGGGEERHDCDVQSRAGVRRSMASVDMLDEPTPAPSQNNGSEGLPWPSAKARRKENAGNHSQQSHQESHTQQPTPNAPNRSRRTGGTTSKKRLSPPRFSFQSSVNSSSKKTPMAKKTLPSSRAPLSASSATATSQQRQWQQQQRSSNKFAGRRSMGTVATTTTATARKRGRHTFRPSTDGSSAAVSEATPARAVRSSRAPDSVRELEFAPSFLLVNGNARHHANADDGGGNNNGDGRAASPGRDLNDVDDEDLDAKAAAMSVAFSRNIVLDHERRLRAQRKAETASVGRGHFVRRLRSLRDDDARGAMRLRSPASFGARQVGGGGGAFLSRKRRRSGGGGADRLDPRNAASSSLDVTVSGICLPDDAVSSALGEGRSVLLAYIHGHNNNLPSNRLCNKVVAVPCYAWIIMTNDEMREQGIAGDSCKRRLRFYDAVVIPPRVVEGSARSPRLQSAIAAPTDDEECHIAMPTVVCTHVCHEYPIEGPTLNEVSFEGFV